MGTGIYSSEYVVATKTIGKRLTVTGGLGWGRLGSYNGFTNPLGVISNKFETRPIGGGVGGEPSFNQWFRGDAAFFGGVSYAASDRLTFKAEYSSDAYSAEQIHGLAPERFVHRSPFNFGVSYQVRPGINLSASYLYGSVAAVSANFTFNPRHPPSGGSHGPAPLPVKPRPSRRIDPAAWGDGWVNSTATTDALGGALAQILAAEGMELESLALSGTTARIRIRNLRYDAAPQAIGRTARILTQVLPASVETFRIEPVVEGFSASEIVLRRTDIERLEHASDGAWRTYTRAQINGVVSENGAAPQPDLYPRLSWGLQPYQKMGFFEPGTPLRIQVGAEVSARYDIRPSLSVSGAIRQPLFGNLSSSRASNSVIQHVRSDQNLYSNADGPLIDYLTLDYFFHPGENIYGHISAGYLEQMYGGLSAEVLWKPVSSRLALGGELNYVRQRDFDQQFGFQDYSVLTGHASAYYDLGNGFHSQLDVGRYLAKDWGATLTIDREFRNGWKVGAFFTITDVPFTDFGEGSFDKGIRISIPVSWSLGQPSRQKINTTIRSLTRDGGARLDIRNRLYEQVREFHDPALRNRWGRFWR